MALYISHNFKKKCGLVEALKKGKKITVWTDGPFPVPKNGLVTVQGPHGMDPPAWTAKVVLEKGVIAEVIYTRHKENWENVAARYKGHGMEVQLRTRESLALLQQLHT